MQAHCPPPLNVVVMHGRPLLAMGAFTALSRSAAFRVRTETAGAARAAAGADVVVADYRTGLQLLEDMEPAPDARQGGLRVLVLTTRRRPSDIEHALRMGVHAYVLDGCEVEELVQGVETVARGARYLCTSAAQFMADGLSLEPFTTRQLEVLQLLTRGLPNKRIARELGVGEGTVKSHVKALLAKLGAQSRTEAMSVAIRRGIVAVPH